MNALSESVPSSAAATLTLSKKVAAVGRPPTIGFLSSNRHTRGRAQGVPQSRGVFVVEDLPGEDRYLSGGIGDRLSRPRRRKTIGLVRRSRVGIRIAVGRRRPCHSLFPAQRAPGHRVTFEGS
jgi:hypothetical protein